MTTNPPPIVQDTAFPKALDKDLQFQIRMIVEKWRRFYPCINYYPLLKCTTPVQDTEVDTEQTIDGQNLITGADGNTGYDLLYGESVGQSMKTTGWQQPHQNDAHDASEEEQFADPCRIHFRFFREAKQRDLQRWGFDKLRDVVITTPRALLDAAGIEGLEGDKFTYQGEIYIVVAANNVGYWKNTNVPLYRVFNCEHRRRGA